MFAESVRIQFKLSASSSESLSKVFKADLGIDFEENQSWSSVSKDSEARFGVSWTGSTQGAYSTSDGVDSAIAAWCAGITEENAVPIKFTENGGISISSLIEESFAM